MVTAVALNALILLSWYGGTAYALLFRMSTAGWGKKHVPLARCQQRHHRLSRLGVGRSRGQSSLGAADGISSSSGSSSGGEKSKGKGSSGGSTSSEAKPGGFGSRASRRSRISGKGKNNKANGGGSGFAAKSAAAAPVVVLKRSSRWACVKNCGACCYLAPEERPDLAEYLPDPAEFDLYISMAEDDGWCKHFDKENRACTIYNDRPRFCRVETETFGSMYGVEAEDMDDFCSACCNEQISDVYGAKSKEMRAFNKALAALERGERPDPELNAFGGDLRGHGERQIRDWGLDEVATAEMSTPADEDMR
ncbi:unnamed protein product [Scytosiphon promiscuus]